MKGGQRAFVERSGRRAQELGGAPIGVLLRAAARYLDELDAESVTRQIDKAVAAQAERDDPWGL